LNGWFFWKIYRQAGKIRSFKRQWYDNSIKQECFSAIVGVDTIRYIEEEQGLKLDKLIKKNLKNEWANEQASIYFILNSISVYTNIISFNLFKKNKTWISK
jgi:hypothetical protein